MAASCAAAKPRTNCGGRVAAMPHVRETIAVAGATVRLWRGGRGTPLVFLHGAGEHPGFGASDDPPWLDGVGDLAYFHLDLLAALGLERVHLMGTSLGGWVAAEMAVRNTARLASLCLVCAVGITAGGRPIPDIFRMPVEENLRRYFADPALAARRLADLAKADPEIAARNRATVMRLAYRPRFHNPDLAKWLHRIDVPTLLLWGEKDGLVPPEFGAAYRELIPGSRLVVLPDAGHAPFDEQQAAFLAAFRDFVSRPETPRQSPAGAG